jgi:DNA-binding NarL/FixJ family response regulator
VPDGRVESQRAWRAGRGASFLAMESGASSAEQPGPRARDERAEASERAPLRVMIADDDPLVRTLVSAMIDGEATLELVGQARDAEEAVTLALEIRPDVALIDWMMPKGGGAQAARDLTACCPETALVALTSADTEEAAIDMLRAGAKSFVVKGGSQEELVRTLHRVVTL